MQADFFHFLFTASPPVSGWLTIAVSSDGLTASCAIHFALRCRRVVSCLAVMADIVLTTLNAKYLHAAFGLRYLLANLGELKSHACLAEFDIHQRPLDVVEALLIRRPRIVGFGVYIWNVSQATEVIAAL
jgi:hypothetical protein